MQELLNTITGRLMTSIFGEKDVIDLSIPQTEKLDHAAWESLAESNTYLAVSIEDTPILIIMHS